MIEIKPSDNNQLIQKFDYIGRAKTERKEKAMEEKKR